MHYSIFGVMLFKAGNLLIFMSKFLCPCSQSSDTMQAAIMFVSMFDPSRDIREMSNVWRRISNMS